jgi:GT2 family glycosyltransferase
VLVVDNASADESACRLRREFPDVVVLDNNENVGFAGGSNIGIRWALARGAEYVLLFNNDAEAHPAMLQSLVAAVAGDATIGIATGKIYVCDRPNALWACGGYMHELTGVTGHHGGGQLDRGQYDTSPRDVDYAPGCVMLIRAAVVHAVGLFDESYFHGAEDVDYCLRARDHGFRTVCVPQAVAYHKVSASVGSAEAPLLWRYLARNKVLLARKRARRVGRPARAALVAVELCRNLAGRMVRRNWRGAAAIVQGVVDGIRGTTGPIVDG